MPRIKMLIGLPGSGKTTYAKQLMKTEPDWIHLSSDNIAYAEFGIGTSIDHQYVFEELYKQTSTALETGKNVIYDATNLASKKRRSFLNRIQKFEAEAEAVVFFTPYDLLKNRNQERSARERVPDCIIERYIRAFHFPRKDEKFNCITVISAKNDFPPINKTINAIYTQHVSFEEICCLYESFEETKPLLQMKELQPTVQKAYRAFIAVRNGATDLYDKELLSWAALLSVIGKPYVRKNRPSEQDNYYGYEHVSMYLSYSILRKLRYSESFIFDALLLIDEHAEGRYSKRGKIRRRIGAENHERLQVLLEALNPV
ncbi:AAA family ATPase [Planococcus sp. YIM B11945]|uniref:AAA family ATPase n=1 Tax=Planococcus sp. YIM B11945 TaxID=3435410 RepID=UPI003D7D83C5